MEKGRDGEEKGGLEGGRRKGEGVAQWSMVGVAQWKNVGLWPADQYYEMVWYVGYDSLQRLLICISCH